MRWLLSIAAIVTVTITSVAVTAYTTYQENVWEKWIKVYGMVAELARAGCNVSEYVNMLNESLIMIEKGNYSEASQVLDTVAQRIKSTYHDINNLIMAEHVRKYLVASLILITPIIFYFLFPTIYLEIWYRLKKRWVIKE